jgi:N-methylhydantoinase A
MLGIVVANMVRAIRAVSVERGYDPRDFVLLPFGGAGPLHATDVARSLGIRRCLVPFAPGILCAQGLVVSDLRETFVRTAITPLAQSRAGDIATRVGELAESARSWFTTECIAPEDRRIEVVLDARYTGQNFELPVALGADPLCDAEDIRRRFLAEHERAYGFYNPDDPVEIVNFRLIAIGRLLQRPLTSCLASDGRRIPVPSNRRPVWFSADRPLDTPVYDRGTFAAAAVIIGPAVIEQLDATTLLFPGDQATVDAHLNLNVELAA